jgi:hypothetical protein
MAHPNMAVSPHLFSIHIHGEVHVVLVGLSRSREAKIKRQQDDTRYLVVRYVQLNVPEV